MSVFSLLRHKSQEDTQKAELRQAWERWQAAEEYFNQVTDPDLVECAIHNLACMRKHYIYLLKRRREAEAAAEEKREIG